jgi:hypothetical protein
MSEVVPRDDPETLPTAIGISVPLSNKLTALGYINECAKLLTGPISRYMPKRVTQYQKSNKQVFF